MMIRQGPRLMGRMSQLRKRRRPRQLWRNIGIGILPMRLSQYGLEIQRKLLQRSIMSSTRRLSMNI
nr:hypothetical protein Iba_chr09cCG4190 [Ipomoea batatas]GMD35226.1 hypothetical protein Iba_chr09dCG4940 [Ipomoea batatas]